jgi:hypothetical protein
MREKLNLVELSWSANCMAGKSNTLKRESDLQTTKDQDQQREEAYKALRRLREIGENLPVVDAVAIVRESRDLAEQGSR